MAFDKKTYQKEYMRKKRMEERNEPPYKIHKLSEDMFDGHGRGVPVNGFVMVSFGSDDNRIISEEDWRARLDWTCKHGREGWSCKECLK